VLHFSYGERDIIGPIVGRDREILASAAATHDAAGASALARDILEKWAAENKKAQIHAGIERLNAYMDAHPEAGR